MKTSWKYGNNDYYIDDKSTQLDKLPVAVYKVMFNSNLNVYYLSHIQEKFPFNYKVYGQENSFVNRVIKTYHNTKNNLGVLLNGVKGTGKTVTAQRICNELGLPVIVVHQTPEQNVSLASFINDIQQNVIVFFDEFEKLFKQHYDDGSTVLTIMDGVLNTDYRRVFLLTTNKITINDNMLQRPSRIRYVKTFVDLSLEAITEIIDDKLVHLEHKQALIDFISKLEVITVDIVKAIIDEVNIHNESPFEFKDIFNVTRADNLVNLYEQEKGGQWKLTYPEVKVNLTRFDNYSIQDIININDNYYGQIKAVLNDHTAVVSVEDEESEKNKVITIRIEKLERRHKSFSLVF